MGIVIDILLEVLSPFLIEVEFFPHFFDKKTTLSTSNKTLDCSQKLDSGSLENLLEKSDIHNSMQLYRLF
jgi:hypothetical protein